MNELNRSRKFLAEDIFSSEVLRVLKSRAVFEYKDGVKTDIRVGTFVEVIDLITFDKYQIKLPMGNEVESSFDINVDDLVNFQATLYVRNNRIFWSLQADAIIKGDI